LFDFLFVRCNSGSFSLRQVARSAPKGVILPLRIRRPIFLRLSSGLRAVGAGRPNRPRSFLLGLSLATIAGLVAGATGPRAVGQTQNPGTVFINEYRVEGARQLPRRDIEEAVYPFLGPGRTKDDVERARAALEQAYFAKGFQTVAVQVPQQEVKRGVIFLQVVERPVGRLRVKGARYSSPDQLKAMTPSLAEGGVIDFTRVPQDIIALNQLPDRRVTPSLRAGVAPDTVDVDLDVKESLPLHASVEVNNRHGPDTTPLRVSGSVSANNLWQAGHGAGFSFQVSPQNTSEVKVFSGYYLARFPGAEWLTLLASATKQDSNVSTLGNTAVAGRGTTASMRAMFSLPAGKDFSHTAGVGLGYKHFDQKIQLAASGSSPATEIVTPITYYPLDATYSAVWQDKRATTEFNTGVTFHVRGLGSDTAQFGNNRYKADASFLYFHGDLAQTRELPAGFQLYGKVQGQIADQPLLSGEQASGGGVGTARGYLEAEAVGDNALFGSLELRSPSLLGATRGEWRFYAFSDAGWLKVNNALPGQKNHFDFLSYGIGSRWRILDHFDGAIIASFPLLKQGQTETHAVRIGFKAGFDY
jgi:hemolysin activation/secretion protein